jgi:nicotinamidase-related amidase
LLDSGRKGIYLDLERLISGDVPLAEKEADVKTALILIDIQNDYFPGGKGELEGSIDAGLHAGRLLAYFREKGAPLVHIQHVSTRPGAAFFLPDTEGVKIHESVRPFEGEVIFQKHFPNSFRETPLLAHLQGQGVGRVVIAGMMTHMCIDATTRAAFDYGFECWVAQDACATRTLTHQGQSIPGRTVHLSFLAALSALYGKVSNTDEMIGGLSL